MVIWLLRLVVTLLLCGLFATRDCCTEVLDVPVAVVNRRLEMMQVVSSTHPEASDDQASYLRGIRRSNSVVSGSTEEMKCMAFYADCSAVSAVCAVGSTCQSVESNESFKDSSAAAQCVPDETMPEKCVARSCPDGWRCSGNSSVCVPASNYLCYIPASGSGKERTAVQFTTESDSVYTAIEAIFQLLQIAASKHHYSSTFSPSASTSQDWADQSTQRSQSPTLSPSMSSPSTISATLTASSSSSGSGNSSSTSMSASQMSSASSLSSQSTSSSVSASRAQATESATVKVAITKPINSGVYTLSSTMLVEWHVTLLSGPDPGLNTFRVDFSANNSVFDTIATNVSTASPLSSNEDGSTVNFQFKWTLADNTSWLCTICVLRICALDVDSVADDSLCIRSDGKSANSQSNRRLQSTAASSSDDVTFRIVREAFECSCGLNHESFLLAAVIIGVCIPVLVLLVEPLVTFYRDRQVCGLFARRNGPVRPVVAGYSATSATHKGRVVLVVVLLVLCVACGFVAAQITSTNFLTENEAIIVLWMVIFAIAVALGVLVYCTLVCFAIFCVRWWREGARDRREPSGLTQLRSSLLSDDVNANNQNISSLTRPTRTERESVE